MDLKTMMKILSTSNPVKLEFERQINFKKLKIFYQINIDDPWVMPVDKEIVAAMKSAINYFYTKHGVVAQEVNIKFQAVINMFSPFTAALLLADIPNVAQHVSAGKVNNINGVLEFVKFLFGKSNHSLYTIIEAGFADLFLERDKVPMYKDLIEKLRKQFEEMLDENSVLFFPTLPISGFRHYEMLPNIFGTAYVGVFNFLGLPATHCPLGLNRHGMPHGMQIIAGKNYDPLTLACAEELDKVFGGWIPPS